jgi:hypothetical protein
MKDLGSDTYSHSIRKPSGEYVSLETEENTIYMDFQVPITQDDEYRLYCKFIFDMESKTWKTSKDLITGAGRKGINLTINSDDDLKYLVSNDLTGKQYFIDKEISTSKLYEMIKNNDITFPIRYIERDKDTILKVLEQYYPWLYHCWSNSLYELNTDPHSLKIEKFIAKESHIKEEYTMTMSEETPILTIKKPVSIKGCEVLSIKFMYRGFDNTCTRWILSDFIPQVENSDFTVDEKGVRIKETNGDLQFIPSIEDRMFENLVKKGKIFIVPDEPSGT